MTGGTAIVVGAGPGLGAALGKRFAAAGMPVALCSRGKDNLDAVVARVSGEAGPDAGSVSAWPVDARDEAAVADLFARVEADLGPIALAVYNAGAWFNASILDLPAEMYEKVWRLSAFAGFLVGREAARRMAPRGAGTILFSGATASLRGGSGFAAFAGGKFALRALAQSMARELGPRGVHVAHVVIDGRIDSERTRARFGDLPDDRTLAPDDIADAYYRLHAQPRSAWTFEIDLRPWTESF